MRLPKLPEDQCPLKTQYFNCIIKKSQPKTTKNKLSYDWQSGEVSLIDKINNDEPFLKQLIKFQQIIKEQKIPSFYSYFLVESWVAEQPKLQQIQKECLQIKHKQSDYHKINTLIRIRQNSLSKAMEKAKARDIIAFEKINDLRFLNLQIIKNYKEWIVKLNSKGSCQPIFIVEGQNYLIKIINDNAHIIQSLNSWKSKFIYPPNPFFLDEDGNYLGITSSQKQDIAYSIQVLASQKAQELKSFINPPNYIIKFKYQAQQKELNNLKSQFQVQKYSPIISIYSSNKRSNSVKNIELASSTKKPANQKKQPNMLQSLILKNQIGILKQMKSSRTKYNTINSQSANKRSHLKNTDTIFTKKFDSLRNKVQSTLNEKQKVNKPKQSIPNNMGQIRTPKPKIKLLSVVDTVVSNVVKMVLPSKNLDPYKIQKQKSSTFFKKMEKIEEVNEDNNVQINVKPVTQQKKQQLSRIKLMFKNNKPTKNNSFHRDKRHKDYLSLLKRQNSTSIMRKTNRSFSPRKTKELIKTQQSILEGSKVNEIDQSLRIIKGRLRQLTIKRIYQNKNKIQITRQNPYEKKQLPTKQVSMPKLSSSIHKFYERKIDPQKNTLLTEKRKLPEQKEQKPEKQQTENQSNEIKQLKARLKQKQQKVNELIRMLQTEDKQKNGPVQALIKQKQLEKEQFEKEKLIKKLDNDMVQETIKRQQAQYLKLKQEQYRLKEQSVRKQCLDDLEQIKLTYLQKNIQMEKKRQEQQKLNQQKMLELLQQKKKMQEMSRKLQEKQVKQTIMKEIMQERKKKDQIHNINFEVQKTLIQQELKLSASLQEQFLLQMDQHNLQLKKKYNLIQAKNKQLLQQNNLINQKIMQISSPKEIVAQKDSNDIIAQIEEEKQEQQLNMNLIIDEKKEKQQFELLKLKIKGQILDEMSKRKRIQQEQQEAYKQQMKIKLQQIEDQIKNQLKKQQDDIEKMNIEMKQKQIEAQKRQKQMSETIQLRKSKLQLQEHENSQMKQVNNTNEIIIEKSPLLKEQIQHLNMDKQLIQQIPFKQNIIQQANQIIHSNIQKQLNNANVQQISPQKQPVKEKDVKLVQRNQDILEKYQSLQQHLFKCKQLYIQDSRLTQFINHFFEQMDVQARQMMPYSKSELQEHMIRYKADIFDCQSIGWIENDRYMLIGNIGCIQLLTKKYGSIQIQVKYLFNKNNPFQKQFLAKKMKIFQKIGFVYQKKINQECFSIKFIIKVPKQAVSKNFTPPSSLFSIHSLLSIQRQNHNSSLFFENQFATRYLFSQTLKNYLNSQQLADLSHLNNTELNNTLQRVKDLTFTNSYIQTTHIDDTRTQLQINLDLKYIQFYQNYCFVVNGYQAKANENQRIYISKISDTCSIVLMQGIQEDFSLDTFVEARLRSSLNQRQILICFPVWEGNRVINFDKNCPKQYTYKQQVKANFNYGSIINSSIRKQDFKLIKEPFSFSVFQHNSIGLVSRVIFGTTVTKQQTLSNKSI